MTISEKKKEYRNVITFFFFCGLLVRAFYSLERAPQSQEWKFLYQTTIRVLHAITMRIPPLAISQSYA